MSKANRVVIVTLSGAEADTAASILSDHLHDPLAESARNAIWQAMEDAGIDPDSDRDEA